MPRVAVFDRAEAVSFTGVKDVPGGLSRLSQMFQVDPDGPGRQPGQGQRAGMAQGQERLASDCLENRLAISVVA